MRQTSDREAAPTAQLWRDLFRGLTWVAGLANVSGGLILFVLLGVLVPYGPLGEDRQLVLNAAVGGAYLVLTLAVGTAWVMRHNAPLKRWLCSGGPPGEQARTIALRLPLRFVQMWAFFWVLAAVIFTLLNLPSSGIQALVVGGAILMGGETTCGAGYLMSERVARSVAELALAGDAPPKPHGPGVRTRLTVAWSLGTGVPLLGIALIAAGALIADGVDSTRLAASILFLALVAMGVGVLVNRYAARSIAEPLAAVRKAVARVEAGDLDVAVPVDDGSEVGLLEAGFNRMVAGLRERERVHDLFGRQVGREVAQAALDSDGEIDLGGELREVAVLFVDLVGSTSMASRRPPSEVVATLNEFFGLVVEAAERHGGWVNKFEGDAALCVFGAPTPRESPATDALAAARALRDRVVAELEGVEAGIGVSAGPVVAGNVGAEERFEYTVIGDPVNEAARLCDLAKDRPGGLLASQAALSRADNREASRWEVREFRLLRGRDEPTGLATPLGSQPAAATPARSAAPADR